MKKKLSIFLVLVMMASMLLTACGNKQTEETQETTAQTETEETEEAYHIAVVTPTLSVSEDEFRAGEQLEEQYPDIVKHLVLPENLIRKLRDASVRLYQQQMIRS